MPLLAGKSEIGHNVREMERAGHPHDQAVAAALRTADDTSRHADDPGLPATCEIRNLVAFGPGFHKGEDLWTEARSARVPENFRRLPGTVPTVKLGHDKQQRFAQSLGFPAVGTVSDCRPVPGHPGVWAVDLSNVPTDVGRQWNAGFLKSVSAELKPEVPLPEDATVKVGPVLTGVSLLGEELPAVRNFGPELQKRATSDGVKATFADGTPVPPASSAARWLDAMADVTRAMAAEYGGDYDPATRTAVIGGRAFSDRSLCFSDFNPDATTMTPEQKQALAAAGFTPEQVEQMEAALGAAAPTTTASDEGPNPPGAPPAPAGDTGANNGPPTTPVGYAAMCKKYAEDPDATPEQKMMAAMYAENEERKKEFAELKKRYSDTAAGIEAIQKKDEEAKMAAFSERVKAECKKIAKKIDPATIEKVVKPTALNILTAKTYAAEADRVKAFSDLFAGFAALPDNPLLSDVVTDGKPAGPAALNASGKKLLGYLKDTNPRVLAKHTAPAA